MPIVRMPNGDQVRFPDDMPEEQIQNLIRKKFPYPASYYTQDFGAADAFGKGIFKGTIGMGLDVPGIGTPSVGELDPAFKKRMMGSDPRHPIAEGLGRLTGPMLAGPAGAEMGAQQVIDTGLHAPYAAWLNQMRQALKQEFGSVPDAETKIGRIMQWFSGPAAGAAKSAASAGMQPTESGSLKSHAENAALGTIEGPLEIAGRGLRKAAGPIGRQVAKQSVLSPVYAGAAATGFPLHWVAPWAFLHGLGHSPLGDLGAKWAEATVRGPQRALEGVPFRAGVGAAIGQAGGHDQEGATP